MDLRRHDYQNIYSRYTGVYVLFGSGPLIISQTYLAICASSFLHMSFRKSFSTSLKNPVFIRIVLSVRIYLGSPDVAPCYMGSPSVVGLSIVVALAFVYTFGCPHKGPARVRCQAKA